MTPYNPDNQALRHQLAETLMRALETAGFSEDHHPGGRELVYVRRVTLKDGRELSGTDVVVYTTIEGGQVRALGEDAIRVCLVYRDASRRRGLAKEARVFRVGNIEEIAERMVERMRKAWTAAKELPRCPACGAPQFTSKAGNKVCAAICWER